MPTHPVPGPRPPIKEPLLLTRRDRIRIAALTLAVNDPKRSPAYNEYRAAEEYERWITRD